MYVLHCMINDIQAQMSLVLHTPMKKHQFDRIMSMRSRGGRRTMGKTKSHKFDGCPMNSHFIGLGLLRTVFEIALARREGPAPAFSCIAGDIEGGICENSFRPRTFDWDVLQT